MDCIKKEFVRTDADGHKWWRVVLTATEAPDSLQLTGADVDGMDDNIRFESGSVLLTPDKNYIAFEGGVFSGEGGGGGGGTGDLVSVTLSPPIPADQELSSFFPINYDSLTPEEKQDGKTIYLVPDQALTEGDEYSYTITPGADWYVNKGAGNFGGQGEAVTLTATVELSDGNPILELFVGIWNEPTIAADKVLIANIIYDNVI